MIVQVEIDTDEAREHHERIFQRLQAAEAVHEDSPELAALHRALHRARKALFDLLPPNEVEPLSGGGKTDPTPGED